jgi:CRISPR/Cas system-associated endonuclease Cas1
LWIGIDIVFLSDYGHYFGRLQGPAGKNPFLRQHQYIAAVEGDTARDLARRIGAGKLVNLRGACSGRAAGARTTWRLTSPSGASRHSVVVRAQRPLLPRC